MSAKSIADQEKKTSKPKDELESGELDKVTGGLKPTGASSLNINRTVSADPCEGGE